MTNEAISCQIVLTTCDDEANATKIAETVVNEGLAACVNILPRVCSIYRWQGRLAKGEEYVLLIKSTKTNYPALQKRIQEIHGYELPEIVAVPIVNGLASYLAWIANPD